jgi:hypothetical protein
MVETYLFLPLVLVNYALQQCSLWRVVRLVKFLCKLLHPTVHRLAASRFRLAPLLTKLGRFKLKRALASKMAGKS